MTTASKTPPAPALLQGTLELLVLKTLAWGPRHGYAIARWLEDVTDDALRIEEGSLYPALYRMEQRGWLGAEWGVSDSGKRIKVYALTAKGRAELRAQAAQWGAVVDVMGKVLRFVPAGR